MDEHTECSTFCVWTQDSIVAKTRDRVKKVQVWQKSFPEQTIRFFVSTFDSSSTHHYGNRLYNRLGQKGQNVVTWWEPVGRPICVCATQEATRLWRFSNGIEGREQKNRWPCRPHGPLSFSFGCINKISCWELRIVGDEQHDRDVQEQPKCQKSGREWPWCVWQIVPDDQSGEQGAER